MTIHGNIRRDLGAVPSHMSEELCSYYERTGQSGLAHKQHLSSSSSYSCRRTSDLGSKVLLDHTVADSCKSKKQHHHQDCRLL